MVGVFADGIYPVNTAVFDGMILSRFGMSPNGYPGLNYPASAVAAVGTDVYVGAGGGVCKWAGAGRWEMINTGGGSPSAFTLVGSDLYMGGGNSLVGKWDSVNSVYTRLGSVYPMTYRNTTSLAAYRGNIYAGGIFQNVGGPVYYLTKMTPPLPVSYDSNGGNGQILAVGKHVDFTLTLSDGTGFTRTGYNLANWNTAANGSGISYPLSGGYNDGAATLFAQWTPITYPVIYDANGGMGSIVSANKIYGQDLVLSAGTGMSKTGYSISGWNTAANGSGIAYPLGGSYSINTAVILYAQWAEAPLVITVTNTTRVYGNTNPTFSVTYSGSLLSGQKSRNDNWLPT